RANVDACRTDGFVQAPVSGRLRIEYFERKGVSLWVRQPGLIADAIRANAPTCRGEIRLCPGGTIGTVGGYLIKNRGVGNDERYSREPHRRSVGDIGELGWVRNGRGDGAVRTGEREVFAAGIELEIRMKGRARRASILARSENHQETTWPNIRSWEQPLGRI